LAAHGVIVVKWSIVNFCCYRWSSEWEFTCSNSR